MINVVKIQRAKDRPQLLLELDNNSLKGLVIQTAACVLLAIEQRNPEHTSSDPMVDPIAMRMGSSLAWHRVARLAALEPQVELLYCLVEIILQEPQSSRCFNGAELRFITDALSLYDGRGGRNWADLNQRLLELTQVDSR